MKVLLLLLFCILNISCSYSQDCIDGINKLPMYGGLKKCKEQIEEDNKFLAVCDKAMSRKDAADHMIKRGWEYFYAKKLDTAMMRFNQAWLLDKSNPEIYWGFGDLLGSRGNFKELIKYLKMYIELNPNNARVWNDISTAYGNVFVQTQDKNFLNSSVDALKKAIVLEPKNPIFYGQLTAAYTYFAKKDSANKYLKITDQLDPTVVNPEVRKILKGN